MSSTSCCKFLDDGRLTDGQGRVVSFKNCVIIMTSNLASHLIAEAEPNDFTLKDPRFRGAARALQAGVFEPH